MVQAGLTWGYEEYGLEHVGTVQRRWLDVTTVLTAHERETLYVLCFMLRHFFIAFQRVSFSY